MTSTQELLEFAVEIGAAAGEITLRWFQHADLAVETKLDGSPVTEADRAAEAYVREQLANRFPDDAVIGEEFPDTPGTSGRTWFIDPIDGTKSFTHGVPLYSTLVAVTDDEGPLVGAVVIPALSETVFAGRELGCFHNGTRTRVSDVGSLDESCLTMSGLEYWPDDRVTTVTGCGALIRTWGDGYGYVLLATGRVEAMIDPGLNSWDVAPMNIVIPEAGGIITNFDGTDLPRDGDVVATNGNIHAEVLDLLSER